MNAVAKIGKVTVDRLGGLIDSACVLGETVVEAFSLPLHPRRFRFGDFLLSFQRAGWEGLPVTLGIGFLLGLILAFQCTAALRSFGVESYISNMLSIALFRELGPLIAAILLAGRSGSAFAAEIGTMKVDEELDALVTMGLPPVRFLMLPRIVAATLAMPILTVFLELSGLIGGAIVMSTMGVPSEAYWRGVTEQANLFMIVFGLAKGALFGAIVGFIGCSAGMRTKSTADGVGVAATSAVVGGIVAITVADGVLAIICEVWKI